MSDIVEEIDRWFKRDGCAVAEQLKSYCSWLLDSRKPPEPSLTGSVDKEEEWFSRCEARDRVFAWASSLLAYADKPLPPLGLAKIVLPSNFR